MNIREAAEYLLDNGMLPPDCQYPFRDVVMEMQNIIDADPWMDEPLTEEEMKAVLEADKNGA